MYRGSVKQRFAVTLASATVIGGLLAVGDPLSASADIPILPSLLVIPSVASVPAPQTDPFYTQPSPVPNVPAGTVLQSRAVTITGLGLPLPVQAWQLLYRSNDLNGNPSAVVGTVVISPLPSFTTPRPLVAYDMAIDSLSLSCAPSYTMRKGSQKEEPSVASLLGRGWDVMVSDFEGLQNQYGVGVQAGQAVLDGLRAAENFAPAELSGAATPVGIWGYSGGGQASAWAAELQPAYAPELNLKGVAEGGVPVNLGHVARNINGGAFSGIYFSAAIGLARGYPQIPIDSILNAKGQAMKANISTQCIEQYVAQYAFQKIEMYTTIGDPLVLPGVQQAIALDTLGQHRPGGPLFIFHSIHDEIIPIVDDDALVARYCSEGVPLQYYRDPVSEHNSLAISGAPLAMNYLSDRFAGKAVPRTC
jgi:hypothetical protein